MSEWKSKLLGDNALNFWGWNLAGLLVFVASAALVLTARRLGIRSASEFLLMANYLVLLGIFGVLLTNYFARVSGKLDGKKYGRERRILFSSGWKWPCR